MKRHEINPRPDWQKRVEEYGMTYHTPNGQPYWNESAYYSFTMGQVETFEKVVAELHEMCLAAAQHVIDHDRFREFGLSPLVGDAIKASWIAEPYVKKPKLGREGANITLVGPNKTVMEQSSGDYGADGYVYQSMMEASVDGEHFTTLGAWVIDGEPAGLGMRESTTRISGNLAQFVPHLIED
jgi:glutathionylspermidine synthase